MAGITEMAAYLGRIKRDHMTQTEILEALGKLTATEHLTDTLCYAA
jgi:hypothetical protein